MLPADSIIVLVATILGCFGNITLAITSHYNKYFYSLFVVNGALLDVLFLAISCCVYLLSNLHPSLLDGNPYVCQTLGTLSEFSKLSMLFGWLCASVYCRQIHCFLPRVKLFRVCLFTTWVVAMAVSAIGLGWGTYAYDSSLKTCKSTSVYFTSLISGLSPLTQMLTFITNLLAIRLYKRYHLQVHWLRHRRELSRNDPEQTTFHSSQTDLSSGPAHSIDNLLLLMKLMAKDRSRQDTINDPIALQVEERSKSTVSCTSQTVDENDRVVDPSKAKPYIIPLKVHKISRRVNKFKSTVSLSEEYAKDDFTNKQFLAIVTCITILSAVSWTPTYTIHYLEIFGATITSNVARVVHFLSFLKSILSPLLYFCCFKIYRKVLGSFMHSIVKFALHKNKCRPKRRKIVDLVQMKNVSFELDEPLKLELVSFSRF